ncbi:MAG: hypothetical protein DMF71_15725 [Acidobacteria bacterium]|nr:MAG: hypothetical protein DMF71_15725 [Acidobacteriota bacterium]
MVDDGVVRRTRQYRGGYAASGLKEFARELRRQPTSAEDLLWKSLRNRNLMGFKFRRQHQFGDYVGDFYCHDANLIVECDGPVHLSNEGWHHDQARVSCHSISWFAPLAGYLSVVAFRSK